MLNTNRYELEYREIAELLIKKLDIHEGVWCVTASIGFQAALLGPSPSESIPGAIIKVQKLGLQRVEKETNTSVDAAKVNPLRRSPSKRAKARTA